MGNRRLYPEPHRRPLAVLPEAETHGGAARGEHPRSASQVMSKWNSPEWEGLYSGEACPICRDGRPLGMVAELNATYLTVARRVRCGDTAALS